MTGYDAYLLYLGLKLHFTPGTYDFFKYGGRVNNTTPQTFDLRKDRYFFHKLARKYPDSTQLKLFLAANFFSTKVVWVRDLMTEEANETYLKRMKVKESLEYTVKEDLEAAFAGELNAKTFKLALKVPDGEYPLLLTAAVHENIHWETLIVLNAVIDFFPVWSLKITDSILWPDYKLKCERYRPFLGVNVKKFQTFLKLQLTS